MDLRPLRDDVLLARLSALVHDERARLGDVIEHLMEVERRDVVLDRGYPSLFEYCVKELRYSPSAAHFRIRAAHASVDFPEILTKIESGDLHLEAVVRLYPHLTKDNSERIIARASGASKREVLQIAAEMSAPTPRKRDAIRPLPPLKRPAPVEDFFSCPGAQAELVPPARRLSFSFEADAELEVLVAELRATLRHKHPGGHLSDIFKETGRAYLQELAKKREPRAGKWAPARSGWYKSRKVPAAIRRAVWARDEGRCAYAGPDGRRCESRNALELDHIVPWADGGRSDELENIRLLCRPHNQRLGRNASGRGSGPSLCRRSS